MKECNYQDTLLEKACAHLINIEPNIKVLVDQHPCPLFSKEGLSKKVNLFERLVSGIIAQQISGAAAKSIKFKFMNLFSRTDTIIQFPTPLEIAETNIIRLRSTGLSQRKAEYIQGLSEKFVNGELTQTILLEASDEKLFEKLIKVRGLGQWSIEMFAIFGLKRIDIFSVSDLGVQRGMAAFIGHDIAQLKSKKGKWKYLSKEEMLAISDKFKPYRSLFTWLMWQVEATDISMIG